jgi:hypothetical protein
MKQVTPFMAAHGPTHTGPDQNKLNLKGATTPGSLGPNYGGMLANALDQDTVGKIAGLFGGGDQGGGFTMPQDIGNGQITMPSTFDGFNWFGNNGLGANPTGFASLAGMFK